MSETIDFLSGEKPGNPLNYWVFLEFDSHEQHKPPERSGSGETLPFTGLTVSPGVRS